MDWIANNWAEVTAIVAGTFSVVSIIVRLTPTPKDDKIVTWIGKLINIIFEKSRKK